MKQSMEIDNYKSLVTNQEKVIGLNNNIIIETNKINENLTKQVKKYKRKSSKLPYWLGAGFLGGFITCQLVK